MPYYDRERSKCPTSSIPVSHEVKARLIKCRKHPDIEPEVSKDWNSFITALLDECFGEDYQYNPEDYFNPPMNLSKNKENTEITHNYD